MTSAERAKLNFVFFGMMFMADFLLNPPPTLFDKAMGGLSAVAMLGYGCRYIYLSFAKAEDWT